MPSCNANAKLATGPTKLGTLTGYWSLCAYCEPMWLSYVRSSYGPGLPRFELDDVSSSLLIKNTPTAFRTLHRIIQFQVQLHPAGAACVRNLPELSRLLPNELSGHPYSLEIARKLAVYLVIRCLSDLARPLC
jgi:hypothetical protein